MDKIISFLFLCPVFAASQIATHPGYVHFQKAQTFKNKDFPKELIEMRETILAYKSEKKLELIDPTAVREAFQSLRTGCIQKPPLIPNCEDLLESALNVDLKVAKSDTEKMFLSLFQSQLGDIYFNEGKYSKALNLFNSYYAFEAQKVCSYGHLQALSKILNVYLKISDQASFDKTWVWADHCAKSDAGKNGRLARNSLENTVSVITPSKAGTLQQVDAGSVQTKTAATKKFSDPSALLKAIEVLMTDENAKRLKAQEQFEVQQKSVLNAQARAAMKLSMQQKIQNSEKKKAEIDQLIRGNPKALEKRTHLRIANLKAVKVGMSRAELFKVFGSPDTPPGLEVGHQIYYTLVAREAYSDPTLMTSPDGGAYLLDFEFKFSAEDKLARVSTHVRNEIFSEPEIWLVE